MRRDDAEIAELQSKLGLGSSKDKARLNREYAKLEGYGDDFGDFLDDLDDMFHRVKTRSGGEEYSLRHSEGSDASSDQESSMESPYHSSEEDSLSQDFDQGDESVEEEIIPMKAPAFSDESLHDEEQGEESISDDDEEEEETSEGESEESLDSPREAPEFAVVKDNEDEGAEEGEESHDDDGSGDSDDDDGSSSSVEEGDEDPDHNPEDTYRPTKGEDIYGKPKESAQQSNAGKYVPPHLRKKQDGAKEDRTESLRALERLLNNSLNRLSDDTLLSVAQAIAKLYEGHPKSDLNDSIWKITRNTCVERSFLMTGLTPVYVAALVGVHFIRSSAQLAEHLVELTTTSLCGELERQPNESSDQDPESISKRACNLALLLCYLYNFGVVHCNLLYDLIRKMISNFQEVDVEVLLIFLSHCGRSLRSDDPLALKEIVLDVQKRAVQDTAALSSRVDYMLSAMMDLKNNKRRTQDIAFAEKTSKLRKSIGHIKSKVASSNGKASDNSLRITLKDILEADLKGRWWKVGASWAGNQFKFQEGEEPEEEEVAVKKDRKSSSRENDEKLLKLASKYRMNSDIRRSVFCIIMGAADCEDAFEKIVRTGVPQESQRARHGSRFDGMLRQ